MRAPLPPGRIYERRVRAWERVANGVGIVGMTGMAALMAFALWFGTPALVEEAHGVGDVATALLGAAFSVLCLVLYVRGAIRWFGDALRTPGVVETRVVAVTRQRGRYGGWTIACESGAPWGLARSAHAGLDHVLSAGARVRITYLRGSRTLVAIDELRTATG